METSRIAKNVEGPKVENHRESKSKYGIETKSCGIVNLRNCNGPSQRCGAGEDETKGGVDFMGQSAPGPIQLVVNHFDHSSNNLYSSKTLPFE